MRRLPALFAAAGFAAALGWWSAAEADVGPPDKTCTAERRCTAGGVECRYVRSRPEDGDLACEEDAKARGFEYVCARGGGTVGVNVYCPNGQVRKSGSCAVDPDAGLGAPLLGLALVFAVRVGGRRQRRRAPTRTIETSLSRR